MTRIPAVGERFELAQDDIYGFVDQVVADDDGEPAALVIAMDNGKWASVDLSKIDWIPATVH